MTTIEQVRIKGYVIKSATSGTIFRMQEVCMSAVIMLNTNPGQLSAAVCRRHSLSSHSEHPMQP